MNFAKSGSLLLAGACSLFLSGCNDSSESTSVAITPQPLNSAYYTSAINGPHYSVISVQNPNSNSSATINAISLQGDSFQIINRTAPGTTTDANYGNYAQCATSANPALNQVNTLTSSGQCIIVLAGTASSPMNAPSTGTLSITTSATGAANQVTSTNTQTFNLKNTTYLYAAGNFHNLDGASAGSNYLLAACNNGACQNYLTNGGGADQPFSSGELVDSLGNLYVGGRFHNLGNATAGSNYLLAKCAEGICQNYFNNSTTEGADSPIQRLAIDNNENLYVGGGFQNLGSASTTASYLLAKCHAGSCQNYFGPGSTAGAEQSGVLNGFTLISIENGKLYVSGTFNNLNGASTSSAYLLAQCTIGNNATGSCQNYLTTSPNDGLNGIVEAIETDSSANLYPVGYAWVVGTAIGGTANPDAVLPQCSPSGVCTNYLSDTEGANAPILSITKDTNGNLYLGGGFTQLGSVNTTPSADLLLAKCSQGSCQNYFSDNGGATGDTGQPWEGISSLITDANGNLYAGGNFTGLDNISTANGQYLLAVCSTTGQAKCQNFLNDSSGADGLIYNFAISNQLTVTPQQ